jgi:hypothetical protein
LRTTPAIAGLRIKLQPYVQNTYELLAWILREESGIDLARKIAEEEQKANDRLPAVGANGGCGNQHTGVTRRSGDRPIPASHYCPARQSCW